MVVKKVTKLLIVEDEKPIRNKMVYNVDWQAYDYEVFQASNGKEALSILKSEEIEILVTDIRMPILNGIELIRKAREKYTDLKVIIISGYAEFEYAQQSIRLEVDDYLLKPFRSKNLLKVVNKAKRKIIEKHNKKKELEDIKKEINEYLKENNLKKTLNWLSDNDFFEKQSYLLDNNKLFRVLKTGSSQELMDELELLLGEIDEYASDRQRVLFIINNIIIHVCKILRETGYDLAEILGIIDSKYLESITAENINLLKKWLVNLFTDLDNLLRYSKDEHNDIFINDIKSYINDHFSEGITLNEIASHFNISTGYLSKLFLDQVGNNFKDYLNMIRLNKAKELLKTTDKKIYEVADDIGFNDSYYFSSWFKKVVGVTPTTFRDNLELL